MKQECPTYLKTIGKSKALAPTLNDIEPEDDSEFKKMDDQDDIHIVYEKLYKIGRAHV